MKNKQEKLNRNEEILRVVDERILIAKKESEEAEIKVLSNLDNMGNMVDFMVKAQIVESLLKIKLSVYRSIEDLINEIK